MIEKAGNYKARAFEALLTNSKQKGTPAVEVNFRVTDGEYASETVRWSGWLTDKAQERTIEALQHCGWGGDDISVFARGELAGLDVNEVEVAVEMEPYDGPNEAHKGKSFPKVKWVNRLGGRGLNVENAMKPDQAASFADRMKGLVHKVKSKAIEAGDASFPFGANAPAAGERKF